MAPPVEIVLASDSQAVREDVKAVLGGADITVREVTSGLDVIDAVDTGDADLVILDFQIGTMGAFATCLELRLAESVDRLPHVPVMMLLDRRPDVFLAQRSGAEGWVIKPLDPIRLRKAVTALLEGGTYHDDSYKPESVPAATR